MSSELAKAKILLIGEGAVGKTSLLLQFADNKFFSGNMQTIGVDFKTKIITINGVRIQLQIWDTSGQERFRTITKSYYRGAQGILVVFDISRVDTFNLTKYWISSIKELASDDVDVALVGNKSDLEPRVTKEEAINFAKENNIPYFETSAKDNSNVTEVFTYLAQTIYKRTSKAPQSVGKTIDITTDDKSTKKEKKSECNC